MVARRLALRRGNGHRFLALIILQLSLCGALADAMELPADLMLEGVNLLKSVEYAQQQHHTHERRQFPLVATAVEGDVAAELPPMLVSVDDASEELGALNGADETASAGNAREQAENRAGNGGDAEVLVPASDYANMAAKLQQQQQQQQQRQPPIWLQMHGAESAPLSHQRERQQQDYEQSSPPQQQHHHHHYNNNNNNNNNNNKGTFVKLPHQHKHSAHQPVSTTPAATLPPPPPPQRRCAIEITTKLAGVCQAMAPIGSACVADDYMDVYNLDCM